MTSSLHTDSMLPTEKHIQLVHDRLCGPKDIVQVQYPMQVWYSLCHTDPDLPLRLVSKSNISTSLRHIWLS